MHIIVAMLSSSRGIGKDNAIPWPAIPDDMRHFKALTEFNTVLMGRKTWDSLPIKPLPRRQNVVLSRDDDWTATHDPDAWIIGGGEIYRVALSSPSALVDSIHVTHVEGDFECDVFFPEIDENVFEIRHRIRRGPTHEFVCYVRRGVACPPWIDQHYRTLGFFY